MKHYDFVTAIKLKEYYKEKLIGLPITSKIDIPIIIINVIACVAGKQQEYAENGIDLNIDSPIESNERVMQVYTVVAYGKFENVFYFADLEDALILNGIHEFQNR